MAETVLVEHLTALAQPLLQLVQNAPIPQLCRALLVDNDGDWQVAIVSPDVEARGRLAVARSLYGSADVSSADLSRLIVLGVRDPDAVQMLSVSRFRPSGRPIALAESGLDAYVLWVSPSWQRVVVEGVRAELAKELPGHGFVVEREVRTGYGRPDLVVESGTSRVLVEIASADAKNFDNRLRDAAGIANLAGSPLVLVLLAAGFLPPVMMLEPQGTVPVLIVDWDVSGTGGVVGAIQSLS